MVGPKQRVEGLEHSPRVRKNPHRRPFFLVLIDTNANAETNKYLIGNQLQGHQAVFVQFKFAGETLPVHTERQLYSSLNYFVLKTFQVWVRTTHPDGAQLGGKIKTYI